MLYSVAKHAKYSSVTANPPRIVLTDTQHEGYSCSELAQSVTASTESQSSARLSRYWLQRRAMSRKRAWRMHGMRGGRPFSDCAPHTTRTECVSWLGHIQPPWGPVALAKLQCSLRHVAASYPPRETTQGALLIIQNATSARTTAEAGSAGVKRLFRSDHRCREAAAGTAGMAEEVGQHIQPKILTPDACPNGAKNSTAC